MTKKTTIASLNEKISLLTNTVTNQMSTMRRQFGSMLGLSHDGKRNIYDIYGYPESLAGADGFRRMYQHARREGISNRVTWGMAKSCWRDGFAIYAGPEKEDDKILIDEMSLLKKSGFIRKIEKADILNRIGRFSVLYVGIPDGRQPHEELGRVAGNGAAIIDQIYFSPYAYDGIEISHQESDPLSPRYGLPKFYSLQRINSDSEKDTQIKAIRVHWSRIIHLNENGLDSDIEGMGALEPIFNRILDIDKATGGASEAYFRNAKGKIGYEIDPEFAAGALSDPAKKASFQEGVEKFTNDFQDFTVASGAKLKTLPTPHYTPLDTVKVALWGITAQSGFPIRVLTGEGSGQLAGSEDKLAYSQLVSDRQNIHCYSWVNDLLIILEKSGMIKLPKTYDIRFPAQEPSTESEQIKNGETKARTMLNIAQAKSQIGGEGIDMASAFAECGLNDIEVDEPDLDIDEPKDAIE